MTRLRITAPSLLGCLALLWIANATAAQQGDGAAARVWVQAQRLEREEKIDDARNEYNLLVSNFPDTSYAQEALLALARSYRSTDQVLTDSPILIVDVSDVGVGQV